MEQRMSHLKATWQLRYHIEKEPLRCSNRVRSPLKINESRIKRVLDILPPENKMHQLVWDGWAVRKISVAKQLDFANPASSTELNEPPTLTSRWRASLDYRIRRFFWHRFFEALISRNGTDDTHAKITLLRNTKWILERGSQFLQHYGINFDSLWNT